MYKTVIRFALVIVAAAAIAGGTSQLFAGKPGGGGGCPQPRPGCICYELYAPVTCDGGCTYSNQCFASCAGARNCVASGGPTQ